MQRATRCCRNLRFSSTKSSADPTWRRAWAATSFSFCCRRARWSNSSSSWGASAFWRVAWQGQQIPVTFSAGWKQYQPGERPDEMLARADEILYTRKRASKKVKATSNDNDKTALDPDLHLEAKQLPLHVLVDLTCPHCRRTNAFAVIQDAGPSRTRLEAVLCAHCNTPSAPVIPGLLMPGPFP